MILDREKVIVINRSGDPISLDKWQKIYGLPKDSTKVSKHFDFTEKRFQDDIALYGDVVVNEMLFRVLDAFREAVKRPLNINSLNRNQSRQNELSEAGLRTASFSPHVVKRDRSGITGGCAADIDTSSHEQTDKEVNILLKTARALGIKIRVGWKEYQAPSASAPNGYTFIHVDVCPEYYAQGKPWNYTYHPVAFEREKRW